MKSLCSKFCHAPIKNESYYAQNYAHIMCQGIWHVWTINTHKMNMYLIGMSLWHPDIVASFKTPFASPSPLCCTYILFVWFCVPNSLIYVHIFIVILWTKQACSECQWGKLSEENKLNKGPIKLPKAPVQCNSRHEKHVHSTLAKQEPTVFLMTFKTKYKKLLHLSMNVHIATNR